jgi:hypothetical protein
MPDSGTSVNPVALVAAGLGVAVAVGLCVAVGEGVLVSVGRFGGSVGAGGTGVELGGGGELVASRGIRVAAGTRGVFVETGGGAVVDPQPTNRNRTHKTRAIRRLTTISRASGEKRLVDMAFLLIENNPMSRLSVQATIADSGPVGLCLTLGAVATW